MQNRTMLSSVKNRVRTPYGDGIIKALREDGVSVVLLDNWKLATGESPVLFLQPDSIKRLDVISYAVGDKVNTAYGRGVVSEIRADDKIVVVHPEKWFLADGKPPSFYLNAESVHGLSEIDASLPSSHISHNDPGDNKV